MIQRVRLERAAPLVAAAAALAACVAGLIRGSFAAGGSDSSCYLSAGQVFARAAVSFGEPLAASAPWRDAIATFAPAGHVPGAAPASLVPMCPPGLPLLMAAFRLAHLSEFLVVPLLGAVLVWLSFLVGRAIDRPLTGALSAVLVASSPIFLYQVVQPMTDVPAAAWWLLAVAFVIPGRDGVARPVLAGLATSAALLTRPNLAPVSAIFGLYLLSAYGSHVRWRAVIRYALGVLPGVMGVAGLQWAMYGSPLASGYGSAGALFGLSSVVPNLQRYPMWLLQVHTPFLALALPAPLIARRRAEAVLLLGGAAATLACYLPYVVFDDWWYIRFLLPALPMLVILSVLVLVAVADRLRAPFAASVLACVCVALLAGWWVHGAIVRHAFWFRDSERHYVDAGRYAARLPDNTVVLTVLDSGSVHYYANRTILLWDLIPPGELDSRLNWLRTHGRAPVLLLETDEEAAFRARFGATSAIGALDWPPRAQIGRAIRVYDPADRARFLAGERIPTDYVWPKSVSGWRGFGQ